MQEGGQKLPKECPKIVLQDTGGAQFHQHSQFGSDVQQFLPVEQQLQNYRNSD